MTEPVKVALAVIETDAFCERCGFNLRSRPVTRDERLGILICQCPECGGHQPATSRATALTPWLHRLALLAAIVWVGLSLAYAAALFGSLLGLQGVATEALTIHSMRTDDGTAVNFNWMNGRQNLVLADGGQTPVSTRHVVVGRQLVPFLGGPTPPPNQYYAAYDDKALFWVGVPVLALALGLYAAAAIVAAGTWFWRPTFRWLWLAMPVAAFVLLCAMIRAGERSYMYGYDATDPEAAAITFTHDHRAEFAIAGIVAALEIAIFAVGLVTGRKFVRGILTVFSPPGVRQLFAFLWHCDGKTMPPARATTLLS